MKNFDYLIKVKTPGWLFLLSLFFLISGSTLAQSTVSADFADFGFDNAQAFPSGNIDGNISFTTEKNSSSTNPAYYDSGSAIRFYYHSGRNGGSLTLHINNGVIISKVELYAVSGKTPTVTYNVDGDPDANATLSGATYTIDNITASTDLKIRNGNTSNTQLHLTGLKIWFDSGSSSCDVDTPVGTIDGFTPECDYSFVSFDGSAPSGVTYYWQTSEFGTDTDNEASDDLDVYETGDFYVRAFNGECWSDAVGPFHVDINHAPEIAVQPQDQTVGEGGTALFSVEMDSEGGYLYQWFVSTDEGQSWEEIDGEESSELTLSGVTKDMDGYLYSVYILNDCDHVDSEIATLTVLDAPCFEEDFSSLTAGGSETSSGVGSPSTTELAQGVMVNFPVTSKAYSAGGAVKLGTSSLPGSIESRELDDVEGNITINIMVKGWTNVEGDLIVSIDGQSETVSYAAKMADPFEMVSVSFEGVSVGSVLTIETTAKRAFIDDVQIYCEAVVEPPVTMEKYYYAVTSVKDLEPGATYLIVNSNEEGMAYALGRQRGTNRDQAEVMIEGDSPENMRIYTNVATVKRDDFSAYEFTLGGSKDAWTFFDAATKGYLYATTDDKTVLRNRKENNDSAGEWSISINNNGVAGISTMNNPAHYIRYQSIKGRFMAFDEPVKDKVYLFKEEYPGCGNNVVYFSAGKNKTALFSLDENDDFAQTQIGRRSNYSYNALGISAIGGYLYALSSEAELLKINPSNGVVVNLGAVNGLPQGEVFQGGVFDKDKFYWVTTSDKEGFDTMYRINVSKNEVTRVLNLSETVYSNDIVYYAPTNRFYGLSKKGELYEIRRFNGQVNIVATIPGLAKKSFGGMYMDHGSLVAYQHDTGDVYSINVNDGSINWQLEGVMSGYNYADMASCVRFDVIKPGQLFSEPADFAFQPNPVDNTLYITTGKTIMNIAVFNMAGQQVMNLDAVKSVRGELNVSSLPKGVYVVKTLLEDGQVKTFKIVKK